jgi:transcriptional regulator with XRE-family HTH domain
MDKVHIKIKKARKLLGFTQSQAGDLCGIDQYKISDIENGKSKFIPNQYMEFLHINGIDLNSIFDDSFDPKKNEENIAAEPVSAYGKCRECIQKDKIIEAQQKTINTQSDFIEILKESNQDKSKPGNETAA